MSKSILDGQEIQQTTGPLLLHTLNEIDVIKYLRVQDSINVHLMVYVLVRHLKLVLNVKSVV